MLDNAEKLADEKARLRFAYQSGCHAVVEWIRIGFLPSAPDDAGPPDEIGVL